MSSPLRFPLTEVKDKGEEAVRAQAPAALFGDVLSEGTLLGPVTLEGVLRAADDEVLFEGTAAGTWRFECTRCLAPVDAQWTEKVEASAPLDKGPLDLTEDVRQAIGLAEPMKIFCKPDCKGFCPVCGKNRNVRDCAHAPAAPQSSSRPRLTPRRHKG